MKRLVSAFLAVVSLCVPTLILGQKVVLVGTNDTHSQIDPTDDDNMGGVLRRKVVVDSIRNANDNVFLIDMGDAVQGTMYFNLFGGEVENMVMNDLGYDLRILGNHDFDNGMDELKKNLKKTNSQWISTNYKFDDPELAEIFSPYTIKEIDGKKVAFIGVNLEPKGMISEGNYDGVTYLDALKTANATASHLKQNEGVDRVIALTHIGYAPSGTGTSDTELAAVSEDIDLIMGGHSHTLINPAGKETVAWLLPTADTDSVTVTQAGKSGKYIAVVEYDLDKGTAEYKVHPVDRRYDDRVDAALDAKIAPYRKGVDEVMNRPVGKVSMALDKSSDELLNLVADFIRDRASQLTDRVDFAIVNKGGIRRGLPKGVITQGQIQSMLPFNNKVVVLDISGKDILDNLAIMAGTGGNGLSSEAYVEYDPETNAIVKALLNGKPIEADKTYRLATIDYLANGGDYMTPLTHGKVVAGSPDKVYDDLLEMLTEGMYKGRTLIPATARRMVNIREDIVPDKVSNNVLRAGTPADAGMASWLNDSIDALILDGIKQGAFPGAQVLIARHGIIVHDKSYGNITDGGPAVTPSTVYDLASVSKAIGTLPAVMMAVDKGLIDINAPLSDYIPELRGTDKNDLLVKEFLFHETGMPAALNMFSVMMDNGQADGKLRNDIVSMEKTADYPVEMARGMFVGQAAMDTIMTRIYNARLRPTKAYNYSCLNFALLADAVHKVTGKNIAEWSDSLIWTPIGMESMGYRAADRLPLDMIAPTENDTLFRHQTVHGYVHDEMAAFSGGIQGNAGLFANSRDVARMCQMWLNGGEYNGERIMSPEVVEMFTTSVSPTCRRGLGFDKPDTNHPENSPTTELANALTFGHLGFTGTVFWVDPQNDLIVVFLNNRVNPTRNNAAFARMNLRPEVMKLALQAIEK